MSTLNQVSEGNGISAQTAALVAGFGLLAMAVLAPIVHFGIFPNLFAPTGGKSIASAIAGSIDQFRVGIVLLVVVAILDIVVAWALYIVLKSVSRNLSVLAAWMRIVYAGIFLVALVNLLGILQFQTSPDVLKVFAGGQTDALIALAVGSFRYAWDLGLIVFGVHLVVLGWLVLNSVNFPWFIGILLMVAGLGYAVDGFGKFLVPTYSISIAGFTFVGEVVLIVWLFIRGFRGFKSPETH